MSIIAFAIAILCYPLTFLNLAAFWEKAFIGFWSLALLFGAATPISQYEKWGFAQKYLPRPIRLGAIAFFLTNFIAYPLGLALGEGTSDRWLAGDTLRFIDCIAIAITGISLRYWQLRSRSADMDEFSRTKSRFDLMSREQQEQYFDNIREDLRSK